MNPASGFLDRSGTSLGFVELGISAESIGLENAAIAGQVDLRMRAATVARVVEHCGRRVCAAKRLVVAHIDPAASDVALAERQDGDGRVIAVQPFGCHDVGLEQPQQRIQHHAAGAHGIGGGGQADRHALQGVALDLAVQRLVLTKLLVKDHRQQAGSSLRWPSIGFANGTFANSAQPLGIT